MQTQKLWYASINSKEAKSIDVGESEIPCLPKISKHYNDGMAIGAFHDPPNLYYGQIYYEAIDNIANGLKDWFEKLDYKVYCNFGAAFDKRHLM